MRRLVARSLGKWALFAVLGIMAFTTGYFMGQRRGEIEQLREQSGPPPGHQEPILPI